MAAQITPENCEILITAGEAYHAFERAVLEAEHSIDAGFRVFDLTTSLYSDSARAIGDTWFDLLAHKLDQGVRVSLQLSDFDPVVRANMHACTWRTLRLASLLREVTRNPDLLCVRACLHGARVGWLSRMGLWLKSRGLVVKTAAGHNDLDPPRRDRFRLERPGLSALWLLDDRGQARTRFWPAADLAPASHHQKLAVIDGKRVYIGGLDLNDRRYDTKDHELDSGETWHDVQLLIDDADLARTALVHLAEFADVSLGRKTPSDLPKPFLRTISCAHDNPIATLSPKPLQREIRQAHLDHIRDARDMIYIETQFLRDQDIAKALCDAGRRVPDLSLVVILPAAPEDVAFEGATSADARYGEYLQAKSVDRLSRAYGARLFVGSPVQKRRESNPDRSTLHNAPVLYVHAKLSIFDDRAGIVSSANLNGRSMNWDTEAGVELSDPALVSQLKHRCIRHWIPVGALDPYLSGPDAAQAWSDLAQRAAGTTPEQRQSFIVPYHVAPARRFGRNLPAVPEEMV